MDSHGKTQYSAISNSALMGLFGTGSWQSLSFDQRLDACQEVENRYAAANDVAPCSVTAQPMLGGTYGWQSGRTIALNESLLRDGQFLTEDVDENGNMIIVPLADRAPNWNILDTMFHEGTHGIQTEQGRMVETYIQPESDRDLYRIQPIEKEAFAAGQQNTLKAIQVVQQETGVQDPQTKSYLNVVKNDRFEDALRDAQQRYQDPYIESTLAQVIQNRENQTPDPSPSPSYARIDALLDAQNMAVNRDAQATAENPARATFQAAEKQGGKDDGVLLSPAEGQAGLDSGDDGAELTNAESSQNFDDGVSLGAGDSDRDAGQDAGAGNGYSL